LRLFEKLMADHVFFIAYSFLVQTRLAPNAAAKSLSSSSPSSEAPTRAW
jgi:hypothetical protein